MTTRERTELDAHHPPAPRHRRDRCADPGAAAPPASDPLQVAVPLESSLGERARAAGRCRLLVTNDDGIGSPGLRELARTLAEDHDVLVAAPDEDVSGAGTGIGRIDPTDPTGLRRADFDGIEAYAVHGPPGLAVLAAHLGAFGPAPELVVSGVNAGLNTGTSIIHSGTVGAALTGRTFGWSGAAFSLAPGEGWHWRTALPVARRVVAWLATRERLTTINVNVPARPPAEVRGVAWTPIDTFGHFRVASKGADGTALELEVHDRRSGIAPDSDTARCLGGEVTLTLLATLGAEAPPDVDAELVAGAPASWQPV
jgi:5'-nucleotidase